MLFCAYGPIGQQPIHPPPEFESQFAVPVFEVNSSLDMKNAPLPSITLFDEAGKATKTKRVILAEVFDEPHIAGNGNFAFYLDSNPRGRTRRWNGTLPGGVIHLRVRVALATRDFPNALSGLCRVRVGAYQVDGPVDGSWPT